MPLRLVVGPPNSGRAGRLLKGFRDSLGRDPVLVVPTTADVKTFEREVTDADGTSPSAVVGGTVVTLSGLAREVSASFGLGWRHQATDAQRTWLARKAIEETSLSALRASSRHAGFAPALVEAFEELEGERVLPATFTASMADGDDADRELALLYDRWRVLREEHSKIAPDANGALESLISELKEASSTGGEATWGARPVFLYGFDDLSAIQRALIEALSVLTEVTVAVTFEPARQQDPDYSTASMLPLEARAKLHQDLLESAETPPEVAQYDPGATAELLKHLDRNLFDEKGSRMEPDDSLQFLRSSGTRSEAEAVGAEIVTLLASGVEPDEIAIVVRSPDSDAPVWADVFSALEIPVSIEAQVPLITTHLGNSLTNLCQMAGQEPQPETLVAWLRNPSTRARSGEVDRLDRLIREGRLRSFDDAQEWWRGNGKHFSHADESAGGDLDLIENLRAARTGTERIEALTDATRQLAVVPRLGVGELPDARTALELRSKAVVEDALGSLRELDPESITVVDLESVLATLRVPLQGRSPIGRVRFTSPYAIRAQRFEYLFICSLQDGTFPQRQPASPLLTDDRRSATGLPDRSEPLFEERYLFSVCVSRPTERLTLSWQGLDEAGKEAARSPFLDEIRDLLEPKPAESEAEDDLIGDLAKTRELGDVVVDVEVAVGETQLARSLASRGRSQVGAATKLLDGFGELGAVVAAKLELAETVTAPKRLQPEGLEGAAAEAVGKIGKFGASTLESFWECPYRWFVQHQLSPSRIEPPSTPLTIGGLVHEVLKDLFDSHLDEKDLAKRRPDAETVEAWKEEMRRILDDRIGEMAKRGELVADDPMLEVERRKIVRGLEELLEREASRTDAYYPSRCEFGFSVPEEEGGEGPLGKGRVLHGAVDRIDTAESGGVEWGVIRDYKFSASESSIVPQAAFQKEGKLQLPLYLRAVQAALGIEPAAALYDPAKAYKKDGSPVRGMVRKPSAEDDSEGPDFPAPPEGGSRDGLESDEFDARIDTAVSKSEELAVRLTGGEVTRMPIGGSCPHYCDFQAICRREPSAGDGDSSEENDG